MHFSAGERASRAQKASLAACRACPEALGQFEVSLLWDHNQHIEDAMPDNAEVLISIHCVQQDSDLLGILKVATTSGVSHWSVDSVGIPWPIDVASINHAPIFAPPDESEQAVSAFGSGTFGGGVYDGNGFE